MPCLLTKLDLRLRPHATQPKSRLSVTSNAFCPLGSQRYFRSSVDRTNITLHVASRSRVPNGMLSSLDTLITKKRYIILQGV